MFTPCKSRLVVASAAKFEALETLNQLSSFGIEHTYIEIGVGAVPAAIISKSLLSLVVCRTVLFLGSCGQSDEFDKPYVFSPSSVVWSPSDVRQDRSYLVPGAEKSVSLDQLENPIDSSLNSLKRQVCGAGSITKVQEIRPAIFENLELYSVASAWRDGCKKFYAILGVTNRLGPLAHQEWKLNHVTVAKLTADYVHAIIRTDTHAFS